MNHRLRLKPGSLIVFEGVDKAGKSTQVEQLRKLPWAEPAPHFAHLPSGETPLTARIYELLEAVEPESQLAKQLLHLACHAENTPAITRQLRRSAVILDRFWWSTVAYGWHGGRMGSSGLEWSAFSNLIDSVWRELTPDLVFLFLSAHEADSNNRDAVERGYRKLADGFPARTVLVPLLSVEDTSGFIRAEIVKRGLSR